MARRYDDREAGVRTRWWPTCISPQPLDLLDRSAQQRRHRLDRLRRRGLAAEPFSAVDVPGRLLAALRAVSRRLLYPRAGAPAGAGRSRDSRRPGTSSSACRCCCRRSRISACIRAITACRPMARRTIRNICRSRSSRRMMIIFGIQSTLLMPVALVVRFLVLAPDRRSCWPRFHRWLEVHASSFAMNPEYRRDGRRRDGGEDAAMGNRQCSRSGAPHLRMMYAGAAAAARVRLSGSEFSTFISFLNTVRVLGAHEYESDGRDRSAGRGSSSDSIDTPGGPWTELWAPVGLRYHALHHYFPGIPVSQPRRPRTGASSRRCRGTAGVSGIDEPAAFGDRSSPLHQQRTSAALRRSLRRRCDDALRHHQPAGPRPHPSVRRARPRADLARPPRHVSSDDRSRGENPLRRSRFRGRSDSTDHPRGSLPAVAGRAWRS